MLACFITMAQNPPLDDLLKLYNAQDFKSAIEKTKPMLENEPGRVDLNLIIGRSYTDLGEYKSALAFLETTVTNDKKNSWQKAWALSYLGTCYFMLQDYQKAELSIDASIKLNATRNATNSAIGKTVFFGFDKSYTTWKTIETDNFRFHFQNMNDAEIEKYTALREIAFKRINGFFNSSLPKKTDFYVWESREDAKNILRRNLGFAEPELCIVHTCFQQTIGHEMTHVISHYTSAVSGKTRFINEGTAVCFDQTRQDRLEQVKSLTTARNEKIGIKDCWENGDKYPEEILYPLAGLFVKELIDNFGKEKFLKFFKNQTYDNARLLFGEKLDSIILDLETRING